MAIGHLAIRTHSRKHAHTAAAALAYRHGVRLECSRSGETHDYRRRVEHDDIDGDGIVAARPTPLAADLDTLARAIEAAERRGDARLLRDVQLGLPHELDHEARLVVTEEFARYLAERYDTVCAWAVHRPDRRGDARNHHAHLVLPTRALSADGEQLGAKLRQLDLSTKSKAEVQAIRTNWQRVANVALEVAGEKARVDTGRAGAGVMPQPTLGPECTAIERRARPEAPHGLSVAALVQRDVEVQPLSRSGAHIRVPTVRGEALREWGESGGRRDRERLQSPDSGPVTEELVATVAPAATPAAFRQDRPAEHALAALVQPAAEPPSAPSRLEAPRAAPEHRLALRHVASESEEAPLQHAHGPGPLPSPSTHPEETPPHFQGRRRGARARGSLPRVDTASRAAPARFAERLALRRRLTVLRALAVAPPSVPERFRERLAARRARRRLRRVEAASERGPERTLASSLQTLSFGLAPLRQPSIAEKRAPDPAVETERAPETPLVQTEQDAIAQRLAAIRDQALDKRRRRRRAASRRRLTVVRKLSPLRRPRVERQRALPPFRARLAARRRVVPLRRPGPAPKAAPQRLPGQDLAAEAEAALDRLGPNRTGISTAPMRCNWPVNTGKRHCSMVRSRSCSTNSVSAFPRRTPSASSTSRTAPTTPGATASPPWRACSLASISDRRISLSSSSRWNGRSSACVPGRWNAAAASADNPSRRRPTSSGGTLLLHGGVNPTLGEIRPPSRRRSRQWKPTSTAAPPQPAESPRLVAMRGRIRASLRHAARACPRVRLRLTRSTTCAPHERRRGRPRVQARRRDRHRGARACARPTRRVDRRGHRPTPSSAPQARDELARLGPDRRGVDGRRGEVPVAA